MTKYDIIFTSESDCSQGHFLDITGWTISEIKELLDSYNDNDIFNLCGQDGDAANFWIAKSDSFAGEFERSRCVTKMAQFERKVECE